MEKLYINPYYLAVPLNPIAGLADDDEAFEAFKWVVSTNESHFKQIIQQDIVPYVSRLDTISRTRIREAVSNLKCN